MSTPSPQQRQFQAKSSHTAIGRICETWPIALDAAQSFGQESGGEKVGSSSEIANPTMNAAMRTDLAAKWIRDVRMLLGPFIPQFSPRYESALHSFVDLLVAKWPPGTTHLFGSLVRLANQGVRNWPPKPRCGEVIDGVKIGSRSDELEYCAECKNPVTGDAADPITRIDGKPFHRKPCYQTVWQRNERARRRIERVG